MLRLRFNTPYDFRSDSFRLEGVPRDDKNLSYADSAESFYYAFIGMLANLPKEMVSEFEKILFDNPPGDYFGKMGKINNMIHWRSLVDKTED